MKTIAIISPGNMGHAVGRVLGSRGFDVVTALADRTPRTRGLAAQAGIRDLGDFEAVVGAADLVLSILPPAAAETAAEAAIIPKKMKCRSLSVTSFCTNK